MVADQEKCEHSLLKRRQGLACGLRGHTLNLVDHDKPRHRGRGAGGADHISTIALNPPMVIRFMSKGIGLPHIASMNGSFITFLFTRSRSARDL